MKLSEKAYKLRERYKEKYGINLLDENNYDLVVDTSYKRIEKICKNKKEM